MKTVFGVLHLDHWLFGLAITDSYVGLFVGKVGLGVAKRLSYPTVIKLDGLHKGKGVVIARNQKEALEGLEYLKTV